MAKTRTINQFVADITARAWKSGRPLAIILAGHNGSGKSTMWYDHRVGELRNPLVNADRMMLSIRPVPGEDGRLRAVGPEAA